MTAVDDTGVGFRSKRGPVLIALMVTTGLVAIDSTILATAVPSIVDDLGVFARFPWLFSIYLLAQADFLEGVAGVSPLFAGLALAALTIGWPISASLSAGCTSG